MDASPSPAPEDVDTIEEAVELLWAAALPIINAVFMCSIGALLARKVSTPCASCRMEPLFASPFALFPSPSHDALHASNAGFWHTKQTRTQGLLKPEGRQVLNQLGFYVFLPALAFSKLAQSISWHDLAIWWPLPLNVFIKCVHAAHAQPLPLS